MSDIERFNELLESDSDERHHAKVVSFVSRLDTLAQFALLQRDQDVRMIGAVLSTMVIALKGDKRPLAALANTAKMIGEYQLTDETGG
jgi:hypothetical protein